MEENKKEELLEELLNVGSFIELIRRHRALRVCVEHQAASKGFPAGRLKVTIVYCCYHTDLGSHRDMVSVRWVWQGPDLEGADGLAVTVDRIGPLNWDMQKELDHWQAIAPAWLANQREVAYVQSAKRTVDLAEVHVMQYLVRFHAAIAARVVHTKDVRLRHRLNELASHIGMWIQTKNRQLEATQGLLIRTPSASIQQ